MRELQWTIFFGVLAVVFVGFGGYYVFKSLNALPAGTPALARSRRAFGNGWSDFKAAFPVIITIAAVVELGYWGYCKAADWGHLKTLQGRAEIAEQDGDFMRGGAYRLRVYELSPKDERKYFVVRDQYLAKFIHGRSGFTSNPIQNLLEIQPVYSVLKTSFPKQAAKDANLEALELYSTARTLTFIKLSAQNDPTKTNLLATTKTNLAALKHRLEDYREKHFSMFSRKPLLGRHVLMADVLLRLGDEKLPLERRLSECRQLADTIVGDYPEYAPGRLLRAQLAATAIETLDLKPLPEPRNKKDVETIEEDVSQASVLDKDYSNLAILIDMGLDDSSAAAFQNLLTNNTEQTKKAAESLVPVAYARFKKQAQLVFENERYANVVALPRFYEAVARDSAERKLKQQIAEARKNEFKTQKSSVERAVFFRQVAESAEVLGKYVLAETWISEAERLAAEAGFPADEKAKVTAQKTQLQDHNLARSLVMLF
jgi:hypothetical protein